MYVILTLLVWSRFYESSQQRYANVATVTWLARHFETVKFPITSSPRARPSNCANAELYRYKIVAVSLHKTHICVVKSLVKIAAVSWHSLRRFIKPAPGLYWLTLTESILRKPYNRLQAITSVFVYQVQMGSGSLLSWFPLCFRLHCKTVWLLLIRVPLLVGWYI